MKEIQNIIPLVSDDSFDPDELRRLVEELDDCRRILGVKRHEKPGWRTSQKKDHEK